MQTIFRKAWMQSRSGLFICVLSIMLGALLMGCSQAGSKPVSSLPTPTSTSMVPLPLSNNPVFLTMAADVMYATTSGQGVYAFHAQDGAKIWQTKIDGTSSWQPSVVNGIVYITSSTGEGGPYYVSALRASDGKFLWRYRSALNMNLAGIENGHVYLSTLFEVIALRATDGVQLWHVHNISDQSLMVAKNIVYLNQISAFSALNASNGAVLWTHALEDRVDMLKSSQGTLYICCDKGKFQALRESDGHVLWSQTVDANLAQTPQLVNGVIYLQATKMNTGGSTTPTTTSTELLPMFSATGKALSGMIQARAAQPLKEGTTSLYAFRASDGMLLWKQANKPGNDGFTNWFQVEQGVVYSMETTSTSTSTTSTLSAWQSHNGKPLWQRRDKIDSYAYTAVIRDGVIYRLGGHIVDALTASDGKILWSHPLAGNVNDVPIVTAQQLYLGTDNGIVYALNREHGQVQWREDTQHT